MVDRIAPALLLLAAACAAQVDEPSITDLHPLDIEDVDEGKADGAVFDKNHIISDEDFSDTEAMSAADVQSFFENTPYGNRSFLADERADGEPLSAALVRVARGANLSPILLLATLQKEAGLVSKTSPPSRYRVDYAFGCGCPDGGSCSPAFRGLDRQLSCAADVLSTAFRAGRNGDVTQSNTRLGRAFTSLDGLRVVAENSATLALYVYTPWVGQRARSGNWLFHNIWKRYTTHLDYAEHVRPRGFIGTACVADADCNFPGGTCLAQNGGLFCSQRCDRYCPDRAGHPTTFCVDFFGDGDGWCTTRCGDGSGCNEGQYCEPRSRRGQPDYSQAVCTF